MTVSASEERFTALIADRERVCCCICPAVQPAHHGVCARFIQVGAVVVLERMGDHYSARCLPCAKLRGYQPRTAPTTS